MRSGEVFDSELARRREAVRLVGEGVKIARVAEQLGRSREWVHKWVARVRADGDAGLADRSRARLTPPEGVAEPTIDEVLRIRTELEANPVASVGAESIRATMERDGWASLPSLASIERILHRAGVTRPYRKSTRSGVRLPIPKVTVPGIWQQADWIHDRWLHGGIRFQSLQAGDVGSGAIAAEQYLTRTIRNASEFILEKAWPVLSIPYAMGVDNAFVKTSHPNNPFTLWVRLCLFFGVEILVAPPGGLGWTNFIEAINNLWQARTIRARLFADLDQLRAGSAEACHWLNHSRPLHDPAIHGTRYPIEVINNRAATLRWPPATTLADHQDHTGNIHIPLAAGRITYIRHATQHRTINITNTNWPLPETIPTGSLLIATIHTDTHQLLIRHHGDLVATHPYPIKHTIVDPYYPPAQHGLLDQPPTMP